MGSIKRMVESKIPGVYVRSLMIGNNVVEVDFYYWICKGICKLFVVKCEELWKVKKLFPGEHQARI